MLRFRTTPKKSVCSLLSPARSLALVLLLILGLFVAVTRVSSGSGHVRHLYQSYLTHANEPMDRSESLPYALGRRLQNDSGKGDDGMYFCIGEDGNPVAMGQNGGGRRTLQRLRDAYPPYCNDSVGGGDPGDVGNSQYPIPSPSYPVASPSTIEVDPPTLQSSDAPFTPDRSPLASPTFVSATLTPHPTFPDIFLNTTRRNLITCQVSCALPPFPEQHDRRARHHTNATPSLDDDDDYSRKHDDVMLDAAVWFFDKVRDVVVEIMRETTNFTIIYNDGHRGGNMLMRGLQAMEEKEEESSPRSRHDHRQESCNGCEMLLLSKRDCNITHKDTIESGPYAGTVWWMYTIAYLTVATDIVHVNTTVQESMINAIDSGEMYRRLQDRFSRLVAVSQPGYEEDAILAATSSDPDGDNDGDFDEINVYEWDPSRWVGLSLFLGTLLCTLILGMTAIHRRKRVQQQEEWGIGLATEAGINQLLTFGWEFDGQQVRAFNKSKFEYRDDDSMRIGGVFPLDGEIAAITESATDGTHSSGVGAPQN